MYYHCTQFNGKHGAKWLREEEITRQLGEVFKCLHIPQDASTQITETLNTLHQDKIAFQTTHYNRLTEERKVITHRCDRLYLDRLDGRITESDYDRFYQSFREQLSDIDTSLSKLQEAEDNYYIKVKYVMDLCSRAYELFIGSEVEEKRQLIKLILSNLTLNDGNLLYEAHKPFDLILKNVDSKLWLPEQDSNLRPND